MNVNTSYGSIPQGVSLEDQGSGDILPRLPNTNRYIYIKNRVHISTNSGSSSKSGSQQVLVNPHFRANNKVFVNPNFSRSELTWPAIHVNPRLRPISQIGEKCDLVYPTKLENTACHISSQTTKIHINPNVKSVQMPMLSQTVHINPKFTKISISVAHNLLNQTRDTEAKENICSDKVNNVLSKTKLTKTSPSSIIRKLKRRNSVKSKYKIVKTGLPQKTNFHIGGNNSTAGNAKNRFKIDNRKEKSLRIIGKQQKRYVYVNKLLNTSQLTKALIIKGKAAPKPIRSLCVVNINGIIYRKSRNSLKRASIPCLKQTFNGRTTNTQYKINCKANAKNTPRKFGRTKNSIVKKFKIIRKVSARKSKEVKLTPKKLKICNIPCPFYRKYGTCKGRDNGKCFRKHDPDQIALCTRFLQGACIKERCLLSHNVSPEKMPTCKYYLEGSCLRENCSYLHVKISPKAEVCRDFLEGFCKKAAECDRRHQYLCPEYEKHGKCMKQRCPYPHGKMVRTYLINKNQFAKKCSDREIKSSLDEQKTCKNEQTNEKRRYYTEKKSKSEESRTGLTGVNIEQSENVEQIEDLKPFIGLQSRPKLGNLPSFIPFGNS